MVKLIILSQDAITIAEIFYESTPYDLALFIDFSMRTLVMQSNYSSLLTQLLSLLSAVLLLNVPSEFYNQLDQLLTVPESLQVKLLPLLGAAVATAFEYRILRKKGETINTYDWLIKFFVAWAAGTFGASADGVINASPAKLAFWSGVGGYLSVYLYLLAQKLTIKDKKNGSPEN